MGGWADGRGWEGMGETGWTGTVLLVGRPVGAGGGYRSVLAGPRGVGGSGRGGEHGGGGRREEERRWRGVWEGGGGGGGGGGGLGVGFGGEVERSGRERGWGGMVTGDFCA